MQLNEQFIVDERGSKQAVVIPFANYLKMLEMLRRQDEPPNANNLFSIWQTDKGSAQGVRAWLERPSLLAFLAACKPSDIDFPDIDNLPPLDDVTNNTNEFKRVPDLIVENWLLP